MGAILEASIVEYGHGMTVADPFSGGGTVTFEAARRGIKAYAQDVYPWPTRGLASALQSCDATVLAEAGQKVLAALEPLRSEYRTPAGNELSHVLRVRMATCRDCEQLSYQFTHPLVSVKSRRADEPYAFFGCYACGSVSRRLRGVASFSCDECGSRWITTKGLRGCVHCSSLHVTPTGWHPVLVQELTRENNRWKTVLRAVHGQDPVRAEIATRRLAALAERIPRGKETNRLVDNALVRWGDLYTQRQADVLIRGLRIIKQLRVPRPVEERLAFCIIGAAEMPAFLSRWDRFHLKAFEGMANHRYTQTTLSVETNYLSPVGRGTLPRRFDAASQTLRWLPESCSALPKVVTTSFGQRGCKKTDWDVLIVTGSSAKQKLSDASVSVVLTDPPYFDDVQYGELARLFHTWLKVYDPSLSVDERQEAVPNSVRGTSVSDYENIIAACLMESRRTLKKDGSLVLTFHNKKLAAWHALAQAICKAGFRVKALAVVRAENDADHCKRYAGAMLHDLVIECSPSATSSRARARVVFQPRTRPEMNLAAIGLAIADCAKVGSASQLRQRYHHHLSIRTPSKTLIN